MHGVQKGLRRLASALVALSPLAACNNDSSGLRLATTGQDSPPGATAPDGPPPLTSPRHVTEVRVTSIQKIDLLFAINNSASMTDKQAVLALTIPDVVERLLNPWCIQPLPDGAFGRVPTELQPASPQDPCPEGSRRQFHPIQNIHIGVVSSSLGGHGADACSGPEVDGGPDAPGQTAQKNFTQNDRGHLLTRGPRTDQNIHHSAVSTYKDAGFLAWDPRGQAAPPGEDNLGNLLGDLGSLIVGADRVGCGYEASLESWYRFLIDPSPPASITPGPIVDGVISPPVVEGIDEVLLQQRAAFLRPDSLVIVVNLADKNDCSIIDGALPPTVCDAPTFDADGQPTGCQEERKGWPEGHAEGNFQDRQVDSEGRVTGTPFPLNVLAAQQMVGDLPFRLNSGTEACETDEYAAGCQSCYGQPEGQNTGCTSPTDSSQPDEPNLRCWNQKKRFGVDFLYPARRYIDGLTRPQVYDREGFLVPNPLFEDLPFKASAVTRPRLPPRSEQLVHYVSIAGVPWQDIARDPSDLRKGYKPVLSVDEAIIDWELILGDPSALDPSDRKPPTDPLMRETPEPRTGTHPITKEAIAPVGWNRINGHERETGKADLQYACIFDLTTPRECDPAGVGTTPPCDCDPTSASHATNPLCEPPDPATNQGTGVISSTQYRAKAFPGTRFLQVARGVDSRASVASICAPNLQDPSQDDFGYRPAFAEIFQRLDTRLSGRCLSEPARTTGDGTAACVVLEARFPKKSSEPPAPGELTGCQACDQPGHRKLSPALAGLFPQASGFDCVCELTQLSGSALQRCQTQPQAPLLSDGEAGWCYIDPELTSDPAAKKAAQALISFCETDRQRAIRFTRTNLDEMTLLIACE